jgi:3-hydroxybutyryl-CoA dehydrogenase
MRIDDLRRVLVIGLGTMGQEIALHCARFGFDVVCYDLDAEVGESCRGRLGTLVGQWVGAGLLPAADARRMLDRIRIEFEPAAAARQVDLLIECVPEIRRAKAEVFARFHELCPPEAVFVTNASYLTPSMLAKSTGRPELFAAFHFHDPVWVANVVDIMPHPGTAPATIELLAAFAERIDQIPIVCHKENHGYVFNSMLRSFLMTAIALASDGVADVEDIDRAWMGVMKTPIGPFGILDRIGLDTVYDIVQYWTLVSKDPQHAKSREFIKRLLDAGQLGLKSGHGFYRYPHPAFEQPGFLQPGR